MNRTLTIAIAISFTLHAGLMAALLLGPALFSKDIPGPGSEVHVWVEVPGAAEGFGIGSGDAAVTKKHRKEATKDKRVQEYSPDKMTAASDLAMAPIKRDEIPETDQDSEAGGGGKGSGAGGIDIGRGGNPLLAKIWRKINSSKYYPSSARRKGITGAPRVNFAINKDGRIEWVRLEATCGTRLLDDAAVETVHRAAPFPYYPKPITVTVKYSLTQ